MDAITEAPLPATALDRFLAGLQAGMMAVIVMLGWLGVSAMWNRHTFWTAANQMATLFRGGAAIVPGFGPYTATGVAIYVLVYSLLGAAFALAVPRRLTVLGLMLMGVLTALAWYTLWFRLLGQTLMPLVWLLHSERPMEFAHVLFGVMLARFPGYLHSGQPKPATPDATPSIPAQSSSPPDPAS
jgi:hypothetical protein